MKILYVVFCLAIMPLMVLADVDFKNRTVEETLAQAKEEKKLIFVVFSEDNCSPCKWMKQNVYTDGELAQSINQNFIPLDSDGKGAKPKIEALQYGVSMLPTMMFIDESGKAVRKIEGKKTLVQMKEIVAQMVKLNACTTVDNALNTNEDFCCVGLTEENVNGQNVCVKSCVKIGKAYKESDKRSCCEGLEPEYNPKMMIYTCERAITCTKENDILLGKEAYCCEGLMAQQTKKNQSPVCKSCVETVEITYPFHNIPTFKGSEGEALLCCNKEAKRRVLKAVDGHSVICTEQQKILEINQNSRSKTKNIPNKQKAKLPLDNEGTTQN